MLFGLLGFFHSDFGCPWLCAGTYGPSTPFATPILVIADSVRLLCMIFGALIILYMPTAISIAASRDQRFHFYGLALFVAVSVTTETEHFGDIPNYRLLLNILGCVATAYGLVRYDREVYGRAMRRIARGYRGG